MAPPKLKLHKNTGKLKSVPRPSTIRSPIDRSIASIGGNTADAQLSEADRQFELELYWCIQQLETSLNLPNVRENTKKMEETSKLINTLKNGSQPIIRKRQIMRTTFGDYRSKMASEEQTMAVNPDNIRFEKPTEKATKYHFVKKSAIVTGDNNFKFNFSCNDNEPEILKVAASCTDEKQDESQIIHTNVKRIVPSGNQFRFNFDIDKE
uniref:Uncharacterized protein n=1 Tax=Anopheles minimus TaxID=112268 RepID=A0A182WFB8_9DIPT